MSITEDQIPNILGQDVYSSDGDKIGKAAQVFLDDVTGKPEWVTVQTGLFGTKESFVPIAAHDLAEDRVTVAFDKDTVKAAPRVDAEQGHLSHEEEAELYRHYGMDYAGQQSETQQPATGTSDTPVYDQETTDQDVSSHGRGARGDDIDVDGRTEGRDTSGPTTDEAMTRSEEHLKVGTTTQEAGKARLRKYVVTEQQTVTVPVTHEEVRVEREPITEANRDKAMDGPEISEEEHEVTLHEEQVVVAKEAVPVERVRLGTETVTEDQQVTEEVRKEQIETEGVPTQTGSQTDPQTDPTR